MSILDSVKSALASDKAPTTSGAGKALPKRALIAITSAHVPLYPDGGETGLFVSEALHPFVELTKAGFDVDFVSETGQYVPDAMSLTENFLKPDELAVFNDTASDFRRGLDTMRPSAELNPADYGLFFASAGHAALIDYPTASGLHKLAMGIYNAGGIVSAVCHGPAIFAGLKLDDGQYLAKGRRLTGFTNAGEDELKVTDAINEWKALTCEAVAEKVGATYVAPKGAWDDFVVEDGRIVTGVNPQSATSTAKAAINAFDATA